MPKLTIDGTAIEVPAGATVLQACELAGKEIPRFCYHERLSVAGNCRMCLVEQEKSPKPIASCAMPAAEGMVIHTDTPMVRQARKGVMEFLLANHPLDCPICDQGGECDLQDQAMAYGMDHGRFAEAKRAVRDKNFGPLVKTSMNRCIHCTRCVRFSTEVAGVEELGALGRGEHMEISTYIERALRSELSANIIDLCPVGALTSKPYAFMARPWELHSTESVDVLDAVGSNINVDTRGREVMRVLPRLNEAVNEEWISDKTRFACDGLIRQRLDRPYVRRDGRLKPATWQEAFQAIADRLAGVPGGKIAALAGDLVDAEAMFALKGLMASLGSPNLDCRQDGAALDPAHARRLSLQHHHRRHRAGRCLPDHRQQSALGSPARQRPHPEAQRIRAASRSAVIGEHLDLTYKYEHLGEGAETLQALAEGRHPFFETLKKAERPMLILGQGALTRADGAAVLHLARKLAEAAGLVKEGWNGFNILHTAAARVGGLELGFVPGPGGRDIARHPGRCRQGRDRIRLSAGRRRDRHGEAGQGLRRLSGPSRRRRRPPRRCRPAGRRLYREGRHLYEHGRPRPAAACAPSSRRARHREDWAVLRALSQVLGKPLPYDNLAQLRRQLFEANPRFQRLDSVEPAAWGPFGREGPVRRRPSGRRSPIST